MRQLPEFCVNAGTDLPSEYSPSRSRSYERIECKADGFFSRCKFRNESCICLGGRERIIELARNPPPPPPGTLNLKSRKVQTYQIETWNIWHSKGVNFIEIYETRMFPSQKEFGRFTSPLSLIFNRFVSQIHVHVTTQKRNEKYPHFQHLLRVYYSLYKWKFQVKNHIQRFFASKHPFLSSHETRALITRSRLLEASNSRADSRLAHYARSDPHAFYAHVDVFNRSNGVHTPPVTRPRKIKDREQ